MVLSSPGDPSPGAAGVSMLSRLDMGEMLGVYALLLPPRPMLAYALLQVNPAAAHRFASDAEMDARFDRVYNRTRPALHCEEKSSRPELHGLGFYAHYYPQSAASPPREDFLPDLAEVETPTLIVKGRCDYLSWSSAQEYLGALPHSELLYLRGAGHNAYQDEPGRFMENVRAFLLGRPLPGDLHEDGGPPGDYEGPA
jgi:proline iminopeptidase